MITIKLCKHLSHIVLQILLFLFIKNNFELRTNNDNVSLEENFEIIDMLTLFS